MRATKSILIILFISLLSNTTQAQRQKELITSIIENYFKAIGGKERAEQIRTFSSESVGKLNDTEIILRKKLMLPNLSASSMEYGGKIISKNIFDGKEGLVTQNDDDSDYTKEELKRHKKNRSIFPEFDYLKTAKYIGTEEVDLSNCYVLQIENTKIYYSVESGLKRKGVSIQEKNGKTFLQELYFGKYVEIEGLLFPTNMLMVAGKNKIEFQTRSILINRDVTKKDFEIID